MFSFVYGSNNVYAQLGFADAEEIAAHEFTVSKERMLGTYVAKQAGEIAAASSRSIVRRASPNTTWPAPGISDAVARGRPAMNTGIMLRSVTRSRSPHTTSVGACTRDSSSSMPRSRPNCS